MRHIGILLPVSVATVMLAAAALPFVAGQQPVDAVTASNFTMAIVDGSCHNGSADADCDIDPLATFKLSVMLGKTNLPNYRGFQVRLSAPSALTYMFRPPQQEVVWPDCDTAYYGGVPAGQYQGGCTRTAAHDSSTYLGEMIAVEYRCGAASPEIYTITLLQGTSSDATYLVQDNWLFAPDPEGGPTKSFTIRCYASSTTPAVTHTPEQTVTVTPTPASTNELPTATPTSTPPRLLGDANADGLVNAIDAALVLQYSAGLFSTINPTADANRDGQINAIDAALILQYVAGLISRLTT